ncbi:uncharacterized protein [Montipora foliosa]|uniref:uncharacterized protein n=1 Tax=Montipora foliosa TaxID=591990 RepID=UPI0035F1D88E
MAYHRQGAPTRLTTDASSVGIGAILEQEQEDASYRPIYYASRKLSKVEKRYSQFEREALAVRWRVKSSTSVPVRVDAYSGQRECGRCSQPSARLTVGQTQNEETSETEDFACSVAIEAMPAALRPKQVEIASADDTTLQLVRQAITGDWSRLSGTEELWVIGQVVLRGGRIVMPESLWKQTIVLAHEGHQGMVRTKSRLREKVWWTSK